MAQARAWAWCAVLIGSKLPQIICRQFDYDPRVGAACAQVAVLLGLASLARRTPATRNVAGFIFAVAALSCAWLVLVPLVESSRWFGEFASGLSWGGRFAVSRLLRGAGAVLMALTLIGSKMRARDLFLTVGNWRAPVRSLGSGATAARWSQLTVAFCLVSVASIPSFYFFTSLGAGNHFGEFLAFLPFAIALSAFNAANEEFQFRSVLLARLRNVVRPSEAFLMSAALFGIDHYFGRPSGWAGTLLAGTAGWLWAKSMWETQGFACAWLMHFIEDLLILAFVFSSAVS